LGSFSIKSDMGGLRHPAVEHVLFAGIIYDINRLPRPESFLTRARRQFRPLARMLNPGQFLCAGPASFFPEAPTNTPHATSRGSRVELTSRLASNSLPVLNQPGEFDSADFGDARLPQHAEGGGSGGSVDLTDLLVYPSTEVLLVTCHSSLRARQSAVCGRSAVV